MNTSIATSVAYPQCVKRTDLPLIFRSWKPAHHELLLTELSDPNAGITQITGHLDAFFANVISGTELYRYSLDLGPVVLYAYPSRRFPGKHYIVRESDFSCSCWSFRTGGACQCSQEVREMVEEAMHVYA